jgi:Mg2+ and Co2+ transporter CorA
MNVNLPFESAPLVVWGILIVSLLVSVFGAIFLNIDNRIEQKHKMIKTKKLKERK